MRRTFLFASFFVLCFIPTHVFAATFLFRSTVQSAQVGDVVSITVGVDPMQENINALEGTFTFSSDILEPLAVRTTDSLVNAWIVEPYVAAPGSIAFSGIIPGGLGESLIAREDASAFIPLFSVDFRVASEGTAGFSLPDGVVLLNDGVGSPAQVYVVTGSIPVSGFANVPGEISSLQDLQPPESFTAEIVHDAALDSGRWNLIFSTKDLQTNIAYYEVQRGSGDFVRVQSPYRIQAWWPVSYTVRAVDTAGNVQVAPSVRVPLANILLRWGILSASVCVLMMSGGIIKKVLSVLRKR